MTCLLEWLDEARLDWVGFFPFSREEGTPPPGLDGQVPAELVVERLSECSELQDAITAAGGTISSGQASRCSSTPRARGAPTARPRRSMAWCAFPTISRWGSFADMVVTGADGPDLEQPGSVAPSRPTGDSGREQKQLVTGR